VHAEVPERKHERVVRAGHVASVKQQRRQRVDDVERLAEAPAQQAGLQRCFVARAGTQKQQAAQSDACSRSGARRRRCQRTRCTARQRQRERALLPRAAPR
jgi:hypothetical protein